MTSWRRLLVVLLLGMGIIASVVGCDEEKEEELPPPAEGHLSLNTHALDFGEFDNEKIFKVSNTGDTTLIWSISDTSRPYWADVNPTDGALAAGRETSITVRVCRASVGPGATTATLVLLSDANEDSLTLSVQRTCDPLGDNFDEGAAGDWDATDLDRSQGEGYVVLDPNAAGHPGRLLQTATPTMPFGISARIRRTEQLTNDRKYGILLEGASPDNALCFAVYVDDDTNYTVEQCVDGNWEVLYASLTGLIYTDAGEWNILRLQLYEENQTTYVRCYAGTVDQSLFENVELDDALSFVKMGLLSEEYTIHADWFCTSLP
jgi:hypothetical protein